MKLLANTLVALISACLSMGMAQASKLDSTASIRLLQEVQDNYHNQQFLESKQVINYYVDHQSSEARESQPLVLKRSGNKVYKRFMGLEEWVDERLYLSVYSTRQLLTIDRSANHSASEMVFTSLKLDPKEISKLSTEQDGDHVRITVYPADKEIGRLEYTIDPKKKLMVKQVVYYATPFQNHVYNLDSHPRIEIVTSSITTGSSQELTSFFASEQFLLNQANDASLADRFRNYTINNLLTAQTTQP